MVRNNDYWQKTPKQEGRADGELNDGQPEQKFPMLQYLPADPAGIN